MISGIGIVWREMMKHYKVSFSQNGEAKQYIIDEKALRNSIDTLLHHTDWFHVNPVNDDVQN